MDKIKSLESWLARGYGLVVVFRDKVVYKSKEHGLKSLFKLIKADPDKLKGAIVFDKRVGRAAALLFVLGQVAEIVTAKLSRPAQAVLVENKIKFMAREIVDNILNDAGNDICPFERLAQGKNPPGFYQHLLRRDGKL